MCNAHGRHLHRFLTLSTLLRWSQPRAEAVARLPAACSLPDVAGRTHLQVLRVLLKLLETSRDAKTLAVGCHDLGAFITHYPAGKGLVTGAWLLAPVS